MTGQKTLKAYHQQPNTIEKFKGRNTDAVDAYYQADYMAAWWDLLVNLINNISLSLVTIFGLFFIWGEVCRWEISLLFVLYSESFRSHQ